MGFCAATEPTDYTLLESTLEALWMSSSPWIMFICKPGRLFSNRTCLSPPKAPGLVLQTQDLSLLRYTKAGGSACWTLKFMEDLAADILLGEEIFVFLTLPPSALTLFPLAELLMSYL